MNTTEEITRIKAKMAKLDPSSVVYQTYSDVLKQLQPKEIKLHKETGPTCEGCQ